MPKDIHGRRRLRARPVPPRPGAVAAGGAAVVEHRRRGAARLWLLLLVAVVVALVLWLVLRSRGDATAGTPTSSSPTPAAGIAAGPPSASADAPAARASASAPGRSTPPGPSSPSSPSSPFVSPSVTAGLGPTVVAPPGAGSASVGGGAVAAHRVSAATGEAGTVLFAAGSAAVDPRGRAALAAAPRGGRAARPATVTVTGFADDLAGAAANRALARARAAAVAAALRRDLAGTATVVRTVAVGATDPAVAETTAAGRLADARATVTLPGTALIGGGGVPAHPAAGSAALPAGAIGVALFPSTSAALDPATRAVVAAAAASIGRSQGAAGDRRAVVVTGYTDSVGGPAGAVALSRRRAQAVADALRADLGAAAPTITVRAVGEQQQIASDATADGQRLNRRAVITVG